MHKNGKIRPKVILILWSSRSWYVALS